MTHLSTQPYKGTRDYYPDQKRLQNYIFNIWSKSVESFGYEEYGAPLLEPLEVYAAKSGQELANEQTYTFLDRGDRTVAIRPEMTPTISRMVAAKRQELAYPARLFSIANFMRYERPQKGREREFWQLNADVFGVDTEEAEAEIIVMSDSIMKAFGAEDTDYIIRINNRKLINFVMAQYLGLDEVQAQLMIKLLDRIKKVSEEAFNEQMNEILSDPSGGKAEKVRGLLSSKTMADLPTEITESDAVEEIREVFTLIEHAGVTSAVFDITLMRGLDYYTGTVFEFFDTHPENNRSLFGGGRYDGLVGLFGAEPISAVGIALGGTTFEQFLTAHNLLPEVISKTDLYIARLGENVAQTTLIAQKLRSAGVSVEVDITKRKLDKQIKTADKKHITYVLFVGDNELKNESYTLKNIQDGSEETLSIDELVSHFLSSK